jgi:hypothetical protein
MGAENLVTTGVRTLNRPAPSESLSRLTSRGHSTSKFWVWVDVVIFSDTLLTTYILQRKPILEKQSEASRLWKCQTFKWFRLFDQTDVKADLATWGKSHTKVSGKWCCAKYNDLENKNLQNKGLHGPQFTSHQVQEYPDPHLVRSWTLAKRSAHSRSRILTSPHTTSFICLVVHITHVLTLVFPSIVSFCLSFFQ